MWKKVEDLLINTGSKTLVVDLVQEIIHSSYINRVSDIHIDPSDHDVIVRVRIDGDMYKVCSIPKLFQQELIMRIKVLANLRSDEHLLPQDGKVRINLSEDYLDIRVSILPTRCGQNAVLRLLYSRHENISLPGLGFCDYDVELIKKTLNTNHGLFVVTGPTGSGKTTTLYAILKDMMYLKKNIVTIEDPIEFSLPSVRQVQVNHVAGLDFSIGLRAVLRQDPDILLVGEIRDQETAKIAVQSSLTGHMVFTSMHTNNALGAISRLLDMNIPNYLVSTVLRCVISQRLLKTICNFCKDSRPINKSELTILQTNYSNNHIQNVFFGHGCDKCGNTGCYGRTIVYEILNINEKIQNAIYNNASQSVLKAISIQSGMTTIDQGALDLLKRGIVSFEEIKRYINV